MNMSIIAQNKKAYHNYFIEDKVEAGVELQGWEVKSARLGNVSLLDSFVFFGGASTGSIGGSGGKSVEAYIKNAHFANYENGRVQEQEVRRSRRLLLNRHQIDKLHKAVTTKGVTCVVTKLYFNKRGLVKAEIALARGKQAHDKKQVLKERDLKREVERELRNKSKN